MPENQFENTNINTESISKLEHREKPLENFEIQDKEHLEKTEQELSQMFNAEKEESYNDATQNTAIVDSQMQELIEIAFTKNLNTAIKEARKLGPRALDEFHDKIIKELKQKNINLK
jgi:hypothetical protein